MSCFKFCIASLLCLIITSCYGKYEISRPLDLRQAGVNKVLCMSNGNTFLFHFEPAKPITIMVFDSARREIATRKEYCRYLDIPHIEYAVLKGMYEINGEAVLFFDQENALSRHILVRLRFDAATGMLIEEKLVAESKSKDKRMNFYIMKNKASDKYAILFSSIKNYPKSCDIYLVCFNNKHEAIKEVQLDLNRKKYDYVDVIGAQCLDSGIVVTLGLSKLLVNGTVSHGRQYDPLNNFFDVPSLPGGPTGNSQIGDAYGATYDEYDPTNSIYDHFVGIYYIPGDSGQVVRKTADVSQDVYPFHTFGTYNPFSGALNLLLFGYQDAVIRDGLMLQPAEVMQNLLLKMDENSLDIHFKGISNATANKELRKKDSSGYFYGVPLAVYTNKYGLSTMVSETFKRYITVETFARPNVFETYLGNICVTQFDDDGNELWGTVLPRAQYYKSYRHYYYINQLLSRWNDQLLFGDLPEQVYNRQFVSLKTFKSGRNYYIVYNDNDQNFNNAGKARCDTIYNFAYTNTVCYRIGSKKEVTRHLVFDDGKPHTFTTSFVEGADFDEGRSVYAAMVQRKRGDNVSLHMAWAQLD